MALFGTPETHADNAPDTWTVVKAGTAWHLRTKDGTTLDRFTRKGDALEAIDMRRMYDKEGRWFAGETPAGMRSWAECKAERDARAARRMVTA